jgi:hypothetical protein
VILEQHFHEGLVECDFPVFMGFAAPIVGDLILLEITHDQSELLSSDLEFLSCLTGLAKKEIFRAGSVIMFQ